jgi:hypothetical protein
MADNYFDQFDAEKPEETGNYSNAAKRDCPA